MPEASSTMGPMAPLPPSLCHKATAGGSKTGLEALLRLSPSSLPALPPAELLGHPCAPAGERREASP